MARLGSRMQYQDKVQDACELYAYYRVISKWISIKTWKVHLIATVMTKSVHVWLCYLFSWDFYWNYSWLDPDTTLLRGKITARMILYQEFTCVKFYWAMLNKGMLTKGKYKVLHFLVLCGDFHVSPLGFVCVFSLAIFFKSLGPEHSWLFFVCLAFIFDKYIVLYFIHLILFNGITIKIIMHR